PLIRFGGGHLADDFPAEQDDRPVANQAYFWKFGREQEHGRPRRRHFPEQLIDLVLGADIDAARRIEAKQGFKPVGDPSCDPNFLLVAATQSAQFGSGTRIDLQTLDGASDTLALALRMDQAPA